MFGREKKERETALDRKIKKSFNSTVEARNLLESIVVDVIRKNGVIALYPEGMDRLQAERDAAAAKMHMVNAIAQYEETLHEYDKVLKETGEREETSEWINRFCDSHQVVENVYYGYCMKR